MNGKQYSKDNTHWYTTLLNAMAYFMTYCHTFIQISCIFCNLKMWLNLLGFNSDLTQGYIANLEC